MRADRTKPANRNITAFTVEMNNYREGPQFGPQGSNYYRSRRSFSASSTSFKDIRKFIADVMAFCKNSCDTDITLADIYVRIIGPDDRILKCRHHFSINPNRIR